MRFGEYLYWKRHCRFYLRYVPLDFGEGVVRLKVNAVRCFEYIMNLTDQYEFVVTHTMQDWFDIHEKFFRIKISFKMGEPLFPSICLKNIDEKSVFEFWITKISSYLYMQ